MRKNGPVVLNMHLFFSTQISDLKRVDGKIKKN
jgi:hypothetical protein